MRLQKKTDRNENKFHKQQHKMVAQVKCTAN